MAYRLNELAMQALIQATQIRQVAGLGLTDPTNIYDLAKQLGVEVRFVDIPSLEGMYLKLNQRAEIFISTHRPAGRQASTCGHELGHHVFKHGTQIDEYLDGVAELERFDPQEFLVDCFSGFVLMPKSAVNYAFTIRGWNPQLCTSTQAYIIAGLFGVGYITLLQHMSKTLKLVPQAHAVSSQSAGGVLPVHHLPFLRYNPPQRLAGVIEVIPRARRSGSLPYSGPRGPRHHSAPPESGGGPGGGQSRPA
jgi:Zn-dependent peptidase ImmA (M78 family)